MHHLHRAYDPEPLSIYHLKNLGPLATEHLTTLYNDSLKSCRLLSIWQTSLVIPIPKPGKDSSQGTSYRPISLLCQAAKVLEALIYPLSTNISTRFQTQTLDYICPPAHNRYQDRLQRFERFRPTRGGTLRRHTIACKSRSPTILTVCCSSQHIH